MNEQKTKIRIDFPYIGRLTGTLLGICVVVALLLGVVNMVTEPIITQLQKEKNDAAMRRVLVAEVYEPMSVDIENVISMYRAVSGGEQLGYVVEVKGSGFGGAMTLIVGVDMEGKVTGVEVTKQAETSGVGTKVTNDASVLNRFVGKGGAITVVKNATGDANEVVAVSGATVSSNAVGAAVNIALRAVASVSE